MYGSNKRNVRTELGRFFRRFRKRNRNSIGAETDREVARRGLHPITPERNHRRLVLQEVSEISK